MKSRPVLRCPCINCSHSVPLGWGYFHYTPQEALEKMIEHLRKEHGFDDWIELLERLLAHKLRSLQRRDEK